MRYALVNTNTGVVDNIIEATEGFVVPGYNLVAATTSAQIGSTYEDGNFVDPTPVVPAEITRRQLRIWLVRNSFSLDQVVNLLEQLPDAQERAEALIEWNDATAYSRNHPLLISVATQLLGNGNVSATLDMAFIEAAQI